MGGGKRKKADADVQPQSSQPGTWDCSVCTFRNKNEVFSCEMCGTRKGTSTRKPRLNEKVVEMQSAVQNLVIQQSVLETQLRHKPKRPRVDATNPQVQEALSQRLSPDDNINIWDPTPKQKPYIKRRNNLIPESLVNREKYAVGVTATMVEYAEGPEAAQRRAIYADLYAKLLAEANPPPPTCEPSTSTADSVPSQPGTSE